MRACPCKDSAAVRNIEGGKKRADRLCVFRWRRLGGWNPSRLSCSAICRQVCPALLKFPGQLDQQPIIALSSGCETVRKAFRHSCRYLWRV